MASSPPAAPSEDGPLDRLQRAVAGWVGPVVYALPILEVWLLSRMGDGGANVLLVALQVAWVACFVVVLVICARRFRAPAVPAPDAPAGAGPDEALPPDGASRTASHPRTRRRGDH